MTEETQSLASTADTFSEAPENPYSLIAPLATASSIPLQGQTVGTPAAPQYSSTGLTPSTISQWVPEKSSSTTSKVKMGMGQTMPTALNEEGSARIETAPAPKSEEKDTWLAIGVGSESAVEAPLSAPGPISSTNTAPGAAFGSTLSTKCEEIPPSVLKTAPYLAREVRTSTDPEEILESAPQITTSSIREPTYSAVSEKFPYSTASVPNGRGSPTSSNLKKEFDLEAGRRSEELDKKELEVTKAEVDPNIVDWDGPDDPNNAVNWSEKLKWANVAVIASITFLT